MTALAFNDRYQKTTPALSTDPQTLDFDIFSDADIDVYVNGTLTTDWTVASTYVDGVATGAIVTIATPVATSPTVELVGARDPRRDQFLITAGAQLVTAMNSDLARRAAEAQESRRDIDQSILLPLDDTTNARLPAVASRKGKFLGFNLTTGAPEAVAGGTPGTALGTIYTNKDSAVVRTVQARLDDHATLKDFGAVGDGVADDTTKVENADASTYDVIRVPKGTYISTAALSTFSKRFEGPGHLKISGQHRGRFFSYVDAEQTGATATNFTDQFDGDSKLSPIQIDVQYEVGANDPFGAEPTETFDAATDVDPVTDQITVTAHGYTVEDPLLLDDLGNTAPTGLTHDTIYFAIIVDVDTIQLATTAANAGAGTQIDITLDGTGNNSLHATKFTYREEIIPVFAHLRVGSGVGHNTAKTVDGPGRTASVIFRARVDHNGQGGGVCYNAEAFVNSTRAGATHFLANPAISLFNGNMVGGSNGAFLNCTEFRIIGSAGGTDFDLSAIGVVYNMIRNNDTGALEAGWDGIRIQSKGTKALDRGFMISGKSNIGIDTSRMTTGDAAFAMLTGQRIYMDSSTAGTSFGTTLGDSFIGHASSGIVQVVGGVTMSKITATEWQLTPASGAPVIFRMTAGGTQFAHVGLSGNVAYFGAGSTASDTVVITFKTSASGTEADTATLNSAAGLDLLLSTGEYLINGTRVMDARKTGWTTVPTGTLTRTTFAAFGGQTISGTYQQSEVQAIDDALKVNSERLAALIVDLHAHGMIGA